MINFSYTIKQNEMTLKADGCFFGKLIAGKFEASSIQVEEEANALFKDGMNVADKLAIIKDVYIHYDEDCRNEAEGEAISERAFYNKLENGNPEAFDEMVRQDMMGYT